METDKLAKDALNALPPFQGFAADDIATATTEELEDWVRRLRTERDSRREKETRVKTPQNRQRVQEDD